jgi:hypothetical protein
MALDPSSGRMCPGSCRAFTCLLWVLVAASAENAWAEARLRLAADSV